MDKTVPEEGVVDYFVLPRSYDSNEQVFYVYGTFCCPGCAQAYLLEHATFERSQQMDIFMRMMRDVYGIHKVTAAPPRIMLEDYGGPLPQEKFTQFKAKVTLHSPPFVSYCMILEEHVASDCSQEVSIKTPKPVDGGVYGLRKPNTITSLQGETCIDEPTDKAMYSEFLKQASGSSAGGSSFSGKLISDTTGSASGNKRKKAQAPNMQTKLSDFT